MFAGKKSAQIREILISESAWEEMTCLFAPSLKSRGLHLQLNDTSAEQILNLAAVSRALDVSHSHLRQLIFRGMSVSDALNYLVNEKKGGE